MPLFFAGAAVPFILPAAYFSIAALSGTEADPKMFKGALIEPSIGCGILFSLAAIRNFSPSKSAGYVACLIRVGIAGIVGGFLVGLLDVFFLSQNYSYDPDPWYPMWISLAVSIPACYTFVSTKKLMAEQTSLEIKKSTED